MQRIFYILRNLVPAQCGLESLVSIIFKPFVYYILFLLQLFYHSVAASQRRARFFLQDWCITVNNLYFINRLTDANLQ